VTALEDPWPWTCLSPGSSVPYALIEPLLAHKVDAQVSKTHPSGSRPPAGKIQLDLCYHTSSQTLVVDVLAVELKLQTTLPMYVRARVPGSKQGQLQTAAVRLGKNSGEMNGLSNSKDNGLRQREWNKRLEFYLPDVNLDVKSVVVSLISLLPVMRCFIYTNHLIYICIAREKERELF